MSHSRHISCQALLTPQVPAILEAVFEPTLNMINQDFSEFPEHRVGFFKLLRAINMNCFPGNANWFHLSVNNLTGRRTALLGIPPNQFKLFMDSIIWAIKHTMRDIADTGLNCMLLVLFSFFRVDLPDRSKYAWKLSTTLPVRPTLRSAMPSSKDTS
jgi:exportin-1